MNTHDKPKSIEQMVAGFKHMIGELADLENLVTPLFDEDEIDDLREIRQAVRRITTEIGVIVSVTNRLINSPYSTPGWEAGQQGNDQPTILVIDDEHSTLSMVAEILEEEGFRVVTAINGQWGLDMLPLVEPQLILCDVMMPGMSGVDFCRHVQSQEKYAAVPVILFSAYKQSEVQDLCNYAAFLSKPFDITTLLTLVRSFIEPQPK